MAPFQFVVILAYHHQHHASPQKRKERVCPRTPQWPHPPLPVVISLKKIRKHLYYTPTVFEEATWTGTAALRDDCWTYTCVVSGTTIWTFKPHVMHRDCRKNINEDKGAVMEVDSGSMVTFRNDVDLVRMLLLLWPDMLCGKIDEFLTFSERAKKAILGYSGQVFATATREGLSIPVVPRGLVQHPWRWLVRKSAQLHGWAVPEKVVQCDLAAKCGRALVDAGRVKCFTRKGTRSREELDIFHEAGADERGMYVPEIGDLKKQLWKEHVEWLRNRPSKQVKVDRAVEWKLGDEEWEDCQSEGPDVEGCVNTASNEAPIKGEIELVVTEWPCFPGAQFEYEKEVVRQAEPVVLSRISSLADIMLLPTPILVW